jgi:hypothetical protein
MIRPPRPRIRHLLSVVALAAASLALPAAPASADGTHADLQCTIIQTDDIIPPVTPELRLSVSVTHGLTGTADCTGTIDGYQVTGIGKFGGQAQGVQNCEAGSGKATNILQFPTTGGIKTVVANSTYYYDNTLGISGYTGEMTAVDRFISGDGDCVNTPLSHSTWESIGTIIT